MIHSMVDAESVIRRCLAAEPIRGVAPDYTTLRAAEDLDFKGVWGPHGWATPAGDPPERLLWSEFPNGRRDPIQTLFLYPHLHAACTCRKTRFPCRHVIALLLRDWSGELGEAGPPAWAWAGLDAVRDCNRPLAANDGSAAALAAGMADLEMWLGDRIRQGLASLPHQGRRIWFDAADRLVDAYATEPARELRQLSHLPGASPQWSEQVLPRLGRLALLCRAFGRLDELPPAEQGDLLAAAGYFLEGGRRVPDEWLVCGRSLFWEDKRQRSQTWLWGRHSRRWALLIDNQPAGRDEGPLRPVGANLKGELEFSPSAHPLVARPAGPLRLARDAADELPAGDIEQAVAGYASALSANPWLRLYPAALADLFIEPTIRPPEPTVWRLRDRRGRLMKLPAGFPHGWRLLALAADRPVTLFGEWDGATYTPLSVFDDGWRSLAAWKGLP